MNLNYCELKKNKIYQEVYDELLDEELSMNNPSHNEKIKSWLDKKIKSSNYIKISNMYKNNEDLMEDLMEKISISSNNNENIQGNTIIMFADDNTMYELFYMEDLTKKISDYELNEFGSLTNIFLQPVCWTCGIFKSSYNKKDNIYQDIITISDISKLYIKNFYRKGIMINVDETMIELEFTGENPFNVIGNNFIQSNTLNLFGFSLVPWIEKSPTENSKNLNEKASKIIGDEIFTRVFFTIVCPNTNKKFWDLSIMTIKNILKVINDKIVQEKIEKEIEQSEININPFYFISKHLN